MKVSFSGRAAAGHGRAASAPVTMAAALALGALLAGPALAQTKPAQPSTPAQATPAPVAEPSAARMKLANELLVANGEASSFDSIIPTIVEQSAASFVQTNPDLIRELRDVAKTLAPEYEARRGEITTILARAYAAQFTEAELAELLTFYRSPVGRKLVEQRQELLDDGLKGIQAWSAKFAQEMEARVRAEMKKRGFTI